MRSVFLIGAIVFLSAASWYIHRGGEPAAVWWLYAWGLLLAVAVFYDEGEPKPILDHIPGLGWIETQERFVDETSGALVTVYCQRHTGERAYVKTAPAD